MARSGVWEDQRPPSGSARPSAPTDNPGSRPTQPCPAPRAGICLVPATKAQSPSLSRHAQGTRPSHKRRILPSGRGSPGKAIGKGGGTVRRAKGSGRGLRSWLCGPANSDPQSQLPRHPPGRLASPLPGLALIAAPALSLLLAKKLWRERKLQVKPEPRREEACAGRGGGMFSPPRATFHA